MTKLYNLTAQATLEIDRFIERLDPAKEGFDAGFLTVIFGTGVLLILFALRKYR